MISAIIWYGFAKAASAVGVIVAPRTRCGIPRSCARYSPVCRRASSRRCVTQVITELEKTYSAFIADHADTIARRGLLAPPPTADNVVALPAGRKS